MRAFLLGGGGPWDSTQVMHRRPLSTNLGALVS